MIRSCTSIVEEIENSMNRANSVGRNLPNPSEMLRAADDAASRIWLRNLKSLDAGPFSVSANTSWRNWSATCHASSSSYRFAITQGSLHDSCRVSDQPTPRTFRRPANGQRRTTTEVSKTPNSERGATASRTSSESLQNEQRKSPERTATASRTISEVSRTNCDRSRTKCEASRTKCDSLPNPDAF